MLTGRYLVSTKNLSAVLNKIIEGVAPAKFNAEHLKKIGFASSSDRGIIPLLKDLGFLSSDGTPLQRYHEYRDRSRSRAVMAEALRNAYEDVFHIREIPTSADRPAIEGLFKSKLNSTTKVAKLQAMTFFALLDNADLKAESVNRAVPASLQRTPPENVVDAESENGPEPVTRSTLSTELHYTIQVHLPATKDIEVFNAIFRSLRENLLS
ncbi:DUF5343 domain-containing protein [Nocardia pseudobrasiliensis]|uniref:DUF5343 domain-containing protein n=1 Tax=Nocardia pseudobrasiliensis TaxID=45979 RepID=A0A370IE16_9NOCA|nr:DUF5343 domain-containing protein [Nocardia pseudobrasiliensis]RDI68962.1 hypothetical protein DFR76_101499 [Nocardia pseudobrasiliensis]